MTGLALSDFGSFHIGGRIVEVEGLPVRTVRYSDTWQEQVDPNGLYCTDAMYVQYMVPKQARALPVVFWPGGGLTGVNFETTPDGRPGWYTCFARMGYAVYNTDPVERGRSGWSKFPEIYPQEPVFMTLQRAWESFRFALPGDFNTDPSLRRHLPGTRFPVQAFERFVQQIVPRWTCNQASSVSAYKALLERIGPACVIAFSSGASLALELAQQHPELLAALVLVEPSSPPTASRPLDLARLPILTLFGDYLDRHPEWPDIRRRVGQYFETIKEKRRLGRSLIVDLPLKGVRGNSHFMMTDNNSSQIADLIHRWVQELAI